MIKSYRKRTTPVDLYEIKGHLDGPLFSYGRVGSGKSVSMLSIIQGFHDNYNYKILDLFGGERNEGVFWTLPSEDESYWAKMGVIGRFDEAGPKQYKVNLLYPYFGTKLPKKLPKKLPFVTSKVFTIPLLSLIPEDVSLVIGSTSETSKFELTELLHDCKKKTNSNNIAEIINHTKYKMLRSTLFYKNFLLPLTRNKFLMDKYCDYNLDLISEMRDRETITVLCLEYVPEQFHLFVLNYILRNVMDLVDLNKIGKKNIGFMREAATFFRATDDSVLEDKFKIFRTLLAHYIRMGRRGFFFGLDCQSSSETKGIVEGSSDYILMFKTTSWRDKQELCDELKREKRMRQDQVADLGFLEPGQAYIAEVSRNVKKVQIVLPRTMYWKREYGNFYRTLWDRFGGDWSHTEEITDYIENRFVYKRNNPSEDEQTDSIEQNTQNAQTVQTTQPMKLESEAQILARVDELVMERMKENELKKKQLAEQRKKNDKVDLSKLSKEELLKLPLFNRPVKKKKRI